MPNKRDGSLEDKFSAKSSTVSMLFGGPSLWLYTELHEVCVARCVILYRQTLTGAEQTMLLCSCATVSAKRRAGIVKTIVNELRFIPITLALDSCVMLPPAYISYK